MLLVLPMEALAAKASFFGVSAGVGRFFELCVEGTEDVYGCALDGVKAGVDAIFDFQENTVSVTAKAQTEGTALSVMSFNASLRRDASVTDNLSLYMDTGLESHIVVKEKVYAEVGVACSGGVSLAACDNLDIKASAGISDMLYSSCSKDSLSLGPVGVSAQIECVYGF